MILVNWSDLTETCNCGVGRAEEEQIPGKPGASLLCLFRRQRGVRSKDMARKHGLAAMGESLTS